MNGAAVMWMKQQSIQKAQVLFQISSFLIANAEGHFKQ
jgi:hypothetical protein